MPFGALLAAFGVECLWEITFVERARVLVLPVSIVAGVLALAYGVNTIATQGRVSSSTMTLLLASILLFVMGRRADRIKQGRAVAVLLLALGPLQFGLFDRDYFTGYRLRSGPWLGGNRRGALEALIERERQDHAPYIYFSTMRSTSGLLDTSNRWIDAYWQFYLIKHERLDLLDRTQKIDTTDVEWMQPGSLVLANVGDRVTGSLVSSRQLKQVAVIPEIDRPGYFVILRR
jgi:hypothetical protein